MKKDVHWFTISYIWFSLVLHGFKAFGNVLGLIIGARAATWGSLVDIFFGGLGCVAMILLLKRKKLGFWLIGIGVAIDFFVALLLVVFGMVNAAEIGEVAGVLGKEIASVLLLYGVLKIKKDGVSYWSLLTKMNLIENRRN